MSRHLTVGQICERSLRKVGTYAIRDQGPDPGEIEEARYWLDMLVGHVSASQRCWWLVPATLEFDLPALAASFDLEEAVGPQNWPENGMQFPIQASVLLPDGIDEYELELVRRRDYEDIPRKSQVGRPKLLYIDRLNAPTAHVYPVPEREGYRLRLVVQAFADDVTVDLQRSSNFTITSVRAAWNLYLVTALAAQIGNGPVTRLPQGEIDDMSRAAAGLLADLFAYDNHEQAGAPRRVAYVDF